jgi:hypothetical protein
MSRPHVRKQEHQIAMPDAGGDAVARLAYDLWMERGCPMGSPEEDWYRAERILRIRTEDALSALSAPPRVARAEMN